MIAIPSSYKCVVLSLTGQLLDVCTEESVPVVMNAFIFYASGHWLRYSATAYSVLHSHGSPRGSS